MSSISCFGELLLRFSPILENDWQDSNMSYSIGGAELNVATALSKWNLPVNYITALPDNELSKSLLEYFRYKNIKSNEIVFTGNRIGLYYLPKGLDMKNNLVIYDRDYSSFSTLLPGTINWEQILQTSKWLHISAISPALNQNVAAVCLEAVETAYSMGLNISLDLNYRSKLWKYGKSPSEIIPQIAKYCNVLMGNIWAVEHLLGIKAPIENSHGKDKEELIAAGRESMNHLKEFYTNAQNIAYTFRLQNSYWGMIQNAGTEFLSREYMLSNTVDQVGSGDCFMAGLIYGLYKELPPKETIEFATAAGFGKLFEPGDVTRRSINQILKIAYEI